MKRTLPGSQVAIELPVVPWKIITTVGDPGAVASREPRIERLITVLGETERRHAGLGGAATLSR